MNYVRAVVEIADFVKDVVYAYTKDHASYGITLLLWTFSVFAMIQTIVNILLMSQHTYRKTFGKENLEVLEYSYYKRLGFLSIKIKRVFKEAL